MRIALICACLAFLLGIILRIFRKRKKKCKTAILKSRKFLLFKGEEQKFLKDYLCKIENNLPKVYDSEVDFEILKRAGLFFEKEVLKLSITKLNSEEKKQIVAINRFNAKSEFTVFIVACGSAKEEAFNFVQNNGLKNVKFLEVENLNPQLLFEINKLNLNYPATENKIFEGIFFAGEKVDNYIYKKGRLESTYFKDKKKICCYKTLKIPENENIFNFTNFDIIEIIDAPDINKIKYVKKLSSPFVSARKNANEIVIKYLNKTEKICFSQNNFNFFIKKSQKNVFLIVNFKNIAKNNETNSILCICSSKQVSISKQELSVFLLDNHFKLSKFFELNFSSINDGLNNFINHKLMDVVCKDLLFDIKRAKTKTISNFNFLKNKMDWNIQTVKQILNEVLGVKILKDHLSILPKNFVPNFQFCLEDKLIKFERRNGKKIVEISGREFVNLDLVNLKEVDGNEITFCG